jgi:hypothetical protein
MQKRREKISEARDGVLLLMAVLLTAACANVGRPDGGPYDEAPPVFIGATPPQRSVNNDKQRLSIRFDEYIQLQNASEKVVVSPPQLKQPEIRASGKRIDVRLLDTLKPNTTYTIDFSDAIVDNNESNPLGSFAYSFSTGASIDTLEVSGTVLEASNLEPIKGILVGLHRDVADSAFTTLPFDRVSRTDSRGQFTIRGIAEGSYRLYALMDADQNFRFSQQSEEIAFGDSLVTPRFEYRTRLDTLWQDTLTIDTVLPRDYVQFFPNDLLLRAFKELNASQYLVKTERLQQKMFSVYFFNKADSLPHIKGLNFDERDAFVVEHNSRKDTIHYWIRDSLTYKQDTLSVAMTYLYTDTLQQLVPRTDTLRLTYKPPRARESSARERRAQERERREQASETDSLPQIPPTQFLPMNVKISTPMEVYGQISVTFEEPLDSVCPDSIRLYHKVDSLWEEVATHVVRDTLDKKMVAIYPDTWEPSQEYEIRFDSIAFIGLYGLHTDKKKQSFKVRSLEDYGEILFHISGADSTAFVELLDNKDQPIRQRRVTAGLADFYFLDPGKYGARLVNDRNGNGVWDTGDYRQGIQPEEVFYLPQILELRALMTIDQDWNVRTMPLNKQKPLDITKQKPDEEKKKNRPERTMGR